MSFYFRFGYDDRVKIGTTGDDTKDIFASRIKRGKEFTLVYNIAGEKKPVSLRNLSDANFIAPLSPRALEGLNAIGKRLDASTDLVIKGMLANEEDNGSDNDQAIGSDIAADDVAADSGKRAHVAEEDDEPSKKRAKVRAAGTLSEALNLLKEDEESGKKGKGKQISDLLTNGEKLGNPGSSGSKAGKKTDKEEVKGSNVTGKGDDGNGTKENNTAENEGTEDAEVDGEGVNGVKEGDASKDNMTTDGASDSNPKVNGTKASAAKPKATKANGVKAGGAKMNGTKSPAKKAASPKESPKKSPKKKVDAAKTNGAKAKGETGDGCAEGEQGEEE